MTVRTPIIDGSSTDAPDPKPPNSHRRPVMLRVPPAMLLRIDRAARRLGLSRASFMLASTAEKLEQME